MEAIVIAMIAATPPALAALVALFRTASKIEEKLGVTNGKTPGFMIEKTYDILSRNEQRLYEHQEQIHELDKKLETHIIDPDAHRDK